jgi:hypothetical protein
MAIPQPNPEPSAIRISRMLQRQPRVSLPSSAIRPASGLKLATPRIGRADGGIADSPAAPFTGPIMGMGGGRTDDVPMHVPSGSYVVPADIVSHIGEGNSVNGLAILKAMFQPQPFGASSAPWGAQTFKPQMGPGVPGPSMPKPQGARQVGFPHYQVGPGAATNVVRPQPQAPAPANRFGGHVAGAVKATPIMASAGEFVIPPEEVKRRGGGSINKGHKILDAWIKSQRQQHIKTLEKLPGPAK